MPGESASKVGWPLRHLLGFEVALVRALAEHGVAPQAGADAIARACSELELDPRSLVDSQLHNATPIPALIDAIRQGVPAEHRRWVHYGATSQDVIDTGYNLVFRDDLQRLRVALLDAAELMARTATTYRDLVVVGRTLLRRGSWTTLGFRFACWLDMCLDVVDELDIAVQSLGLQLGGSSGNLGVLGAIGVPVATSMAAELGIPWLGPWQVNRHQRYRVAFVGVLAARLVDQVAINLLLLSQEELGELTFGEGDSSSMPNKHNPASVVNARSAARIALSLGAGMFTAPPVELERSAGSWQAEPDLLTGALGHAIAAADALGNSLSGLEVSRASVAANLSDELYLSETLKVALESRFGYDEARAVMRQILDYSRSKNLPLGSAAHAVANSDLPTEIATQSTGSLIDQTLVRFQRYRRISNG